MFENDKKLDHQLRELAASAHSSINGFMRVIKKGDEYPIVWCNDQVCKKLKRDPSNIIGEDFHIVMPPSFLEWHKPFVDKWFENPYDLTLDRIGRTNKPFELEGSDGVRHPVAVFIRSRPSYPGGVMFGIDAAPTVNAGAWIEIVFMENMFYFREYQKLMALISPHIKISRNDDSRDNIRPRAGGGKPQCGCPVRHSPSGGDAESGAMEPSSSNDGKDIKGSGGDREGSKIFETGGLDP